MASTFRAEKTPLLGPGFHVMNLAQLKEMTVGRFEGSTMRSTLFNKLEDFVQTLIVASIPCELWIDGSFVTEELEPADVDIAIKVMDDVMMKLSDTQEVLLTKISADDEAFSKGLDTFVFAGYWIGHELYGTDVDDGHSFTVPTWGDQFGKSEDNWLKGIVVLPILENDIGLHIRTRKVACV